MTSLAFFLRAPLFLLGKSSGPVEDCLGKCEKAVVLMVLLVEREESFALRSPLYLRYFGVCFEWSLICKFACRFSRFARSTELFNSPL